VVLGLLILGIRLIFLQGLPPVLGTTHGMLNHTSTNTLATIVKSTQSCTRVKAPLITNGIQDMSISLAMITKWTIDTDSNNVILPTDSPAESTEENTAVQPITFPLMFLHSIKVLMVLNKPTQYSALPLDAS